MIMCISLTSTTPSTMAHHRGALDKSRLQEQADADSSSGACKSKNRRVFVWHKKVIFVLLCVDISFN
jgi:hypothetical protein